MSQNYLEELSGAKDRVAVVTGGGTSLGFWMAEAWVKAGGRVWISGRREDALQDACAKLNALSPHSASYAATDLSTKAGVMALHATMSAREPTIDALVNNTGTIALDAHTLPTQSAAEMGAALAGYDRAPWEHIYVLSNWAASVLTGAEACSTSPAWPRRCGTPYETSKVALIALTRILAAPGSCPSAMNPADDPVMPTHADNVRHIPLWRAGNADDVGGAFLYLAGKAGAYVTGANYAVDGGALLVLNNAYAPW